jgi:predicted lipoprotein with Yx(FWY)xxD motif
VIIGVVVYGLIYYFVIAKKGGYSTPGAQTPQSAAPTTSQSDTAAASNIYMMKTDAAKGAYITDFQGMTLYTYDKDQSGVSNCTGTCATNWPPYTSGATAQSQLPANITVVTRADGSKQFAWKGMPLYYFVSDTTAGQITGDGVNGFHIAK